MYCFTIATPGVVDLRSQGATELQWVAVSHRESPGPRPVPGAVAVAETGAGAGPVLVPVQWPVPGPEAVAGAEAGPVPVPSCAIAELEFSTWRDLLTLQVGSLR